MTSLESPMYSVVIPVFNEEENLTELHTRLLKVITSYGNFEIIYIDDGCTDRSRLLIKQFCSDNDEVKLISFSRNFGHQSAVTAGLNYASGDVVAVMDADLQDPPEVLPELFSEWDNGHQVVYAVRRKRREPWYKKIAYFFYYRLLKTVAEVNIPLDSGDFCAMDRVVVDNLNQLPEKNRFIRGIRAWVGFRQTGVEYERHSRFSGSPKYNLRKLLRLGYDGIFSFSKQPLVLSMRLGIVTTIVSFLYIAVTLWRKLAYGIQPEGWTSLMIVVLFFGGVQLLMIGILGEYLGRIFDETKGRPVYIVSETINIVQ